jgi:shikimate kinase
MARVVLTGFMGTGKSTVGRLLAERLGYEFVDTDERIEEAHGPIPQIFAERGEAAFRRYERAQAHEVGALDAVVIATGGRMLLDPEAAAALGEDSRIFCLVASPAAIFGRIAADAPERPLLGGGDDLATRIEELLTERESGYARFEQVPTDGRDPEEVVDDLLARLDPAPGAGS